MELIQPILSKHPEFGHRTEDVFSLSKFLSLLKEEELYFENERNRTSLMITRLRKIFYDKGGWDSMLIKKARFIKGRYQVQVLDCKDFENNSNRLIKKLKSYRKNIYSPKCRLVTYSDNDRVFGNTRSGEIPEIYKLDHADVRLDDNYHCDIGHVLAGLDALNNPQLVSPLPNFLIFLKNFFPFVKSNADIVTWLGDIATSSTDFLFTYLKNGKNPLDLETEQHLININASASDMLGNIDAFAIHYFLKNKDFSSKIVSEILEEYYNCQNKFSNRRFEIFSQHIGLGKLNGSTFLNEKIWLDRYKDELRSAISFMVYHFTNERLKRYILPHKVWKKSFEEVIKPELLLTTFLNALKKLL